ncbi:polymeric immunoglobulin receptor isoform X2 [Hemicordylus capensis]|nr:polymeric immunoglobulin receptor isoform X2 [Hemicordylus capensis]XP_053105641.1 polymeric immunoglobulin receptor isoform X2 [Hemicordylus capensis]XP_053105642.1 polymeric immunoglobulin receptor isoform X2 [Hemicordylus capensis]
MTLLSFIFLLTFAQAVSSGGLVFGPRQVTGLQGGSVTVKCFYPQSSANRHGRKYWCKESPRQCSTILSSNGFVAKEYTGRATLTDMPENGMFIIEISQMVKGDVGSYKCGIGLNDRGLSFQVKLDISEGSVRPEEAQLFYVEQPGSVTMTCIFGQQYASSRKYLCRMTKSSCSNVIDTYGNINPSYKGRILISNLDVPGSFNIIMTQLEKGDSGVYLCGVGNYGADGESKELDLHVFAKSLVPKGQPVLRGVPGGSVSTECHYNPKGNDTLRYWCKWKSHGCTQLINNLGYVLDTYEGRIVMHDYPENGTYIIILNQLKEEDAGYYWCMTNGENERKSTAELTIVEGLPSLTGQKEISAVPGSPLTISCSYPCKYYQYDKYWCKWKNTGCEPRDAHVQNQSGLVVSCDKDSRILSLNFDQVTTADQGWYWCGVQRAGHYGETFAVYLSVHGVLLNSEEAPNPKAGSNAVVIPRKNSENRNSPLDEAKAAAGPGSSAEGQKDSTHSTVLLSVLVPLAVMLLLFGTVFVVLKFKLFKNSDLVSVGSYRTNISMTDFENARQHGAKDNVCVEEDHETQIGTTNEYVATTGSPKSAGKPKKIKSGSKEDLEMAYSTFLLNSENLSTPRSVQEQ